MPQPQTATNALKKPGAASMKKPSLDAVINKSEPRYGPQAPRLTVYVTPEQLVRIDAACQTRPGLPPTPRSTWVLDAILDKLDRLGK